MNDHDSSPNKVTRSLLKANGVRVAKAPAVYKVINIETGSFYVGSTQNASKRLNKHQQNLKAGTHSNKALQSEFNAAPNKDSFVIEVTPVESAAIGLAQEQDILNECYLDPRCLNQNVTAHSGIVGGGVTTGALPQLKDSDKHREVHSDRLAKLRAYNQSDEGRALKSEHSKKKWEDPTFRQNHIKAIGHAVTIDGVGYDSVREAARVLGVAIATIRSRMGSSNVISLKDKKARPLTKGPSERAPA